MSTVARRHAKDIRKAATVVAEYADANRDSVDISLVAAAASVRVANGFQQTRWGGTDWQSEGWAHYDSCPEFWRGIEIGANNLSRARLIGVDIDPHTGEAGTRSTANPVVSTIMRGLFGGPTGQSQALAQLYRNLDVAGEAWVFASDAPDLGQSPWEILSSTDVTSAGGDSVDVKGLDGTPRRFDPLTELLIRIWSAHPKRRAEANAATKALLPVLRELAALNAMVSATVKSRLSSAGILWIPEEITLPRAASAAQNDVTQAQSRSAGAAGWLDLITEAMTAPIRDPDSASAVVPLVAVAKSQYIEKIAHMEFGKDLDASIEPLRQAGVKRLAVGMNLPPEVLLGLGDVNHWTAWAITEDYARAYLAPKLELIADALTEFYLRPALRAYGVDADAYAIGFDLDKLLPKQIATDNATAAHEAGLLADAVYLEAMGFAATDMATDDEKARNILISILKHGNPQTLVELGVSITALFPGITVQPISPTTGAPGATIDAVPDPTARPAIAAPPTGAPSVAGTHAPPAPTAPPTTAPSPA